MLFEGGAEGAVAVEAALDSQLLGGDYTLLGHGLLMQTDEVPDAKPVDVSVISDALLGKVLAQISPVCADGTRQLRQGKVVLQIELRVLAMLFE